MSITTRARRATAGLAGAIITLSALTACGSDDGSDSSSADHNDQDVAFATDMIPHHAQAVEMAAMVDGKDVSAELTELATDIKAAQAPEIETMSGWLKDWDEPVPDTSMGSMGGMEGEDMEGMDHSGMDGMDMPGMMSEEDMTALENADGEAFETMWLEMMVEHHKGAVEMAQTEQSDGKFQPAIDLADEIEAGQTEEISVMEDLLARP